MIRQGGRVKRRRAERHELQVRQAIRSSVGIDVGHAQCVELRLGQGQGRSSQNRIDGDLRHTGKGVVGQIDGAAIGNRQVNMAAGEAECISGVERV